jgi:ribosomal protein L7Ae-like RNA K-turn-binding protein
LKSNNKAAIAPAVIELKFSLGIENTTKDVANSWKIMVIIAEDKSVKVINLKKEVCVTNKFLLEWELSVIIPPSMGELEDIQLKV